MEFNTTINGIRAFSTEELTDVVRIVDFTITGTESGMSFSISASTELTAPDPENFIPLADLTEADVLGWVEAKSTMMDGIKANVEHHLRKQIAQSQVVSKPLPWAEPIPNVTP